MERGPVDNSSDYGAMLDQDTAAAAPISTLVDSAGAAATQPAVPAPLAPSATPQPGPDYNDILDADKAQQRDSLKQSVYAAKDLEPDRHAKVMALASQMNLPVPIVDRNYDDLAKKSQLASTDYEKLIDENPKFSGWLQDPNNAGVAKHDMPALKGLEDQVNDHTFGQTFLNTVGYALSGAAKKLGALPGLAFDALTLPTNVEASQNADVAKRFGINPDDLAGLEQGTDASGRPQFNTGNTQQIKTPDALANNALLEASKYAQKAYAKELPQLGYSILSDIKAMNFHRAAQGMLVQAAASAPDLIGAIGLGMIHPALGAAFFGTSAAAQTTTEMRDEGVDPATGTQVALMHGGVAGLAGELKIFGPLKQWENSIFNMYGKQVSREVFKDLFKTLAGTVAVQGGTGAGMSLADDMADYVTGVNPHAMEGSFERAGNSALVTAATGLALVAPSGLASGLARQQQVHETNSLRDFYLSFGKTAEATKLRQNLPEAQKNLVEQITKDTPVENIYVSPEKLDTYFQSKGLNPVAAMGELGALPEYGAAKETGNDVKIPLATWVDKVVGTEHYRALANDIKFQPDGMSVNDVATENERIKAEADKAAAAAEPPDSAEQVGATVADQLGKLGLDPKQAQLYESAFRTLGERSGQDPLELFNKFKLNITGEEPTSEEGQTLNQDPAARQAELEKAFNGPDAEAKYNALPESKNGQIISQDIARHLDERYAKDREGAIVHQEETQKPSQEFAQRTIEKKIDAPGHDAIVMMAGGTGSGKTTHVDAYEKEHEGTPVFDSTAVHYDSMKALIQRALDHGKPVIMKFVYQTFDKALQGNIDRYHETGRLVQPNVMAHTHVGAIDTFLKLAQDFKGRVDFEVYDNSNVAKGEKMPTMDVDDLAELRYNKDGQSINAAARKLNKRAVERLKNETDDARTTRDRANPNPARGDGKSEADRQELQGSLRSGTGSEGSASGSVDGSPGSDNQRNLETDQHTRVLKQAKLDTEGLPNVVDATDRFGARREAVESDTEAKAAHAKIDKQATKLLGKKLAASVGDLGRQMLISLSARYSNLESSTKIDKAIKDAQRADAGPYVSSNNAPAGMGWIPNYAAEPSGVIGENRILEPHSVDKMKGPHGTVDGKHDTDPLKWSDDKFKATKELIKKHQDKDMPLVINTSSDLVGKSDYIAVMPSDTLVKMHLLTKDEAVNRALFPGNASRLRQDKAIEALRDQGVRVEEIRPTLEDVVNAAGGKDVAAKLLGDDWEVRLKGAIGTNLSVIEGGRVKFQAGEDAPRGQIRIGPHSMEIQILKDADRSTFLHESGHFYLEVLKTLASEVDAPEQIKGDFETIQKWLGHEGDAPISVEQHEQFARGFESYLMEGKAPSEGLRKAFAAFKVWLTNIYKSLKNLNVELTPEVRGVFDRILATDDEIAKAQAKQNFEPLFKEPAIYGLSPEDFARYQSAIDSAKFSADDELRKKVMKDITKEEAALYKEQRANIKAKVEDEANNTRVFRARSLLQLDALPDGSPRPEGTRKLKIDKDSLVKQFGEEILKKMPRMYSREDGTDVNLVADMLGYESGDQMVQEISNSIPKADFVEQQTEARIKDLHPDLLSSGTMPDEAMAAIHNDSQAKVLRMELEFLARDNMPALKGLIKKVSRRVPTDDQIREQAQNVIGSQNVRELNPGQYKSAEARHAREAGENLTKGDIDGAFESKRLELYNHELFKAVSDAKEDVQKSLKLFKKIAITDEKAAKSRDVDLVLTAKAVLSAFGIGKTDDPPAKILEKIKRYDEESYAAAHALVEMATAAGSGNYQEISYNRFSDMRDAVKGIWELAKSSKQVEIDGKMVEKAQILQDLAARINDQNPSTGPGPGYEKAITTWDKTRSVLLSAKAMLRRTEHWVTAMDGGDKGTFRTHIWNPVVDAATKFRLAKEEMTRHYLNQVIQPAKDVFDKKPIEAQELGYTFQNKSELLGALLHTGNESNLSKLLRGRNWGAVDSANTLDTSKWDKFISRMHSEGKLTKADYDYVQGVWDMYDKMKPDAQRAHKKLYGYYFNEVTAKEFKTPFGDYRGGYAPAIADPNMTEDAAIRLEKAQAEQVGNSYMFPTAGRGFTKSRVEAYAAPLALDLGYVSMQIDKVLRFTHLEPAVRDVGKLVMDKGFRQTLATLDANVASEMLVPWLQRSVTQQVSSPSGTGKAWKAADWVFRKVRGNTGLNAMALNVVNTFHQTTGFSMAATKVEPHYLRDALWSYMRDAKGTHDAMAEKSDYMKAKGLQISDLQGDINDLVLHPTKYESTKEFVKKNGYILQRLTQGAVETVAWQGAYTKATEGGEADHEAIRYADSVVRQTQHSSMPEDISRFGTGSPFARLFTMYFDYYNMKANLMTTESGNMIRETGIKKSLPSLVGLYAAGMMIPAIMSAGVRSMFSGADKNDDHSYMNEAMRIFFGGQLNESLALVPVIGPLINNQINRFNDNKYDDRLQLSPAIEALQKAWGAPAEIYAATHGNGAKSPAIRDSLSLLGMMTGLPLQPLAKPLGYLADLHDHKIRPPTGPVDYARGLMTAQGQRNK